MNENYIRPPDEAKNMTLLDNNQPIIESDYDRAIKQSLDDYSNNLNKILLQSQEEFELMQQIKEIEQMEELEKQYKAELRAKSFETIIQKIKKIAGFDKPNIDTYELLLSVINNYIEKDSFKLTLTSSIIEDILQVLKGIRLTNEELSKIKNLFVI